MSNKPSESMGAGPLAQGQEVVGSVATNAKLGPKAAVAESGSFPAFRIPSMASVYPTPCSAEL